MNPLLMLMRQIETDMIAVYKELGIDISTRELRVAMPPAQKKELIMNLVRRLEDEVGPIFAW